MKHEAKQCPRCLAEFECKVGNIHLCQCRRVSLSEHEVDVISRQFDDCLCSHCLQQIKQELSV
ncbi:MAG: cysteine-rich CWC family protein [Gammaproteobacteria bacterium]|nr:cysteine-rich CWC family protein [Gammaproteobacteria bacterium]